MISTAPTTVHIPLEGRPYDIHIGHGLLEQVGGQLKTMFPGARFGVITDENVARSQWPRLEKSLQQAGLDFTLITLPAGEATKSHNHLSQSVDAILEAKLERDDIIIAFGGGVIGDLAGFVAAITRRGMDFVQIPTSLLAQVDSSVGGKTGINSPLGKNLVGAFHQPKLVVADLDVYDSLPPRQFAAGFAEVIKYGLIDDENFFFWLEENLDEIMSGGPARAEAIARSCAAKARFVIADELEGGVRALLNLGHTFGHALETATGYSERLLHGEGVAIGMVLAHRFSARTGLSPSQDNVRIERYLQRAGLPISMGEIKGNLPDTKDLLSLMAQDKKATRGKMNLILTKGIGKAFIAKDVDPEEVASFIEEMR
ncbi:MAG: 3-dehydroquinate synthase [Devosiaceae bacterium]|nr:3-dehydroquinate synthase [Devosiaceae bacterium]